MNAKNLISIGAIPSSPSIMRSDLILHPFYKLYFYDKDVTWEINIYLISPCSRGLWCLERPASILEIGILMGLLGLCQKIAHWHFRIRSPRILKWVNTI